MTKKDCDWVISIYVRKRNSRGKMRGYEIEVTIPAKDGIEALRKTTNMVTADTHLWGKK